MDKQLLKRGGQRMSVKRTYKPLSLVISTIAYALAVAVYVMLTSLVLLYIAFRTFVNITFKSIKRLFTTTIRAYLLTNAYIGILYWTLLKIKQSPILLYIIYLIGVFLVYRYAYSI